MPLSKLKQKWNKLMNPQIEDTVAPLPTETRTCCPQKCAEEIYAEYTPEQIVRALFVIANEYITQVDGASPEFEFLSRVINYYGCYCETIQEEADAK